MKRSDYQSLKQAKAYEEKRFSKGLKKVSNDELALLNSWVAELNITKSFSFADIGSGTGRVLKELLRKRPKIIYAVDQSKAMLNQLQKIYKDEVQSKKIQAVLASSDNTTLKSDSVDAVTAFHLFKHLPHINPTLKEAYRVLKPGGYLIFDALNKDSLVRLRLGSCFALSESELRSKLSMLNFSIQRLSFMHPFGETIYKVLGGTGGWVIHLIDKALVTTLPKLGTKIFVLARKR